MSVTLRKKVAVLANFQRAHSYPYPGVIPNLVTDDGADTEAARLILLEQTLVGGIKSSPHTDKIFDNDRDPKIIDEYALKGDGGFRLERQKPRVKRQGIVGNSLPHLEPRCAETNQIQNVRRQTTFLAAVDPCGELMLFPGTIKQRDHAVVEDIQKVAKSCVSVANAFRDKFRVVVRQSSNGTGKSHKVHDHFGRRF